MRGIVQNLPTPGARSCARLVLYTVAAGALLFAVAPAHAATPEQSCKSGKNKTAGKYAACRENAEAKLAAGGDPSKYTEALDKCETKFSTAWQKLEDKALAASASCPGDDTPIKGQTDAYTDRVAAQVAGNRFVDNGDGTVTDYETGLQWEKKDSLDGGANFANPHDADNYYTWSPGSGNMDGTAFTDFLVKLNTCSSGDGSTVTGGFAGHCDWRLPTIAELQTIVDFDAPGCGSGSPCIDSIFGPTQASLHWSSTSRDSLNAWYMDFYVGIPFDSLKLLPIFVRAVRTGS